MNEPRPGDQPTDDLPPEEAASDDAGPDDTDGTDDPHGRRMAEKDALLEAALIHAAFDGWSRRTLLQAAADLDVDRATALRLFPKGGDSLLAWLDDWADRRMLQEADPATLTTLPVRQRIARLVRARLEVLGEHKEAVRRAAAAHATPANFVGGSQALWRTLGRIWEAAGFGGGKSEGLSYYSRRATLGGVVVSTFLYWLEDTSPDHAETWRFLDRRIADVMQLGKLTGRFKGFFEGLPGRGLRRRARP